MGFLEDNPSEENAQPDSPRGGKVNEEQVFVNYVILKWSKTEQSQVIEGNNGKGCV